jgi:ABC-type nitrate/sulfonate/bicarbonate transport system substrate-binding protein
MRKRDNLRRALMLTVLLVMASSCASVQPYKAVGTTNKDAAEVFSCALGVATSLDYAPEQVSKDSGFFKAEHNYRAGPQSIRWGATMTDALSVLVTREASGNVSVQVTGTSGADAGRNRRLIESSHEVVEAANKIVSTCK